MYLNVRTSSQSAGEHGRSYVAFLCADFHDLGARCLQRLGSTSGRLLVHFYLVFFEYQYYAFVISVDNNARQCSSLRQSSYATAAVPYGTSSPCT